MDTRALVAGWKKTTPGTSVEQLDQPNHARLIAEDFQLDSRIVIHFDATSIISTDFGTGGVIFIDPDSE